MSRSALKRIFTKFIKIVILVEVLLQGYTFTNFVRGSWEQKRINEDTVARTWALKDPLFRTINNEESSVWEQYAPFVGWKTREYHTAHMNVDADGVRRTVGNPTQTGLSAVFFFGGSALWGEGHADDTTIPSQVTRVMNQITPKMVVTNYGEIGYGSTQEVIRLAMLLKSGKRPNHVIFYDGCNDFFLATLDTIPHETFRDQRMSSVLGNMWALPEDGKNVPISNSTVFSGEFWRGVWHFASTYIQIIRYSTLFYASLTQKNLIVKPIVTLGNTDAYTAYIVENYVSNMKIVEALSKEYNFDYLAFWQPTIYSRDMTEEEKKLPDLRIDQYNKLAVIYRDAGRKLSQTLGNTFVDISDVYSALKEPVFTDTCHVTIKGNTLVSQAITNTMQSVWGIE